MGVMKPTRKKPVKRLVPTVKSGKSKRINGITVKAAPKPKPKPKQKRLGKIDWIEVARQFVQGIVTPDENGEPKRRWVNQAELASIFKISESSVYYHARDGEWMVKREDFRRQLREEEDKRLVQELADRRVRSQVAFASTGQNLQVQVQAHLRKAIQNQKTVDPKSLRSLSGALRSAQQVVEVAMGKPADGESTVHVDWTLFLTPPSESVRALPDLDDHDPEIGGVVTPPRSSS
jgi:hypothetical protein